MVKLAADAVATPVAAVGRYATVLTGVGAWGSGPAAMDCRRRAMGMMAVEMCIFV